MAQLTPSGLVKILGLVTAIMVIPMMGGALAGLVLDAALRTSPWLVLAGLAGLRSGTICAAYAQRTDGTFLEGAAKEAAEARCIDAGLTGIHLLWEIDSGMRADPIVQWSEETGGKGG